MRLSRVVVKRLKKGNDLAKFKQTMNQPGTSGTFSPSSLLSYHFSRYFDATVDIPVAVYRSMDKDAHFVRVSHKAFTRNMGKSWMNKAGWQWLDRAEQITVRIPSAPRVVHTGQQANLRCLAQRRWRALRRRNQWHTLEVG